MSSSASFSGGGRTRALTVRRVAGARGFRLVVDPRDGAVKLTLPKRAALGPALAWAEKQRGWVEAGLAKLPVPRPIRPGGTVPYEGEPLLIDWAPALPRAPRLTDGRLELGGPEASVGARVLRWLKRRALDVLDAETRATAIEAEVAIAAVAVGDPRTRWGSCAADGAIRYSWRLIMTPPYVRRATVAHEVAHRLHMDHSRAFHAAVRRLLGEDPAPARDWLKRNGAALHWVGREE
ncbi:MAG: DUF45 domain-containing protein [Sphingomonadaceae bacterium]|nr:DUF45 domain-containing protein [Sphingomonadaceae bacterium]